MFLGTALASFPKTPLRVACLISTIKPWFIRCQRQNIGAGEIWVATAEDIVLAKLIWLKKKSEGCRSNNGVTFSACSRCKARSWILHI